MDDSEVDEFFEGVAGNRDKGQTSQAAHKLGSAARAARLSQRELTDDPLSDSEAQKRDALLDALDARGLFGDSRPSTVTPLRRPDKRPWVRWNRPLALAAALGVCAVGVLQFLPALHDAGEPVERGTTQLTLRSADPAATTRDLAQELAATGATVQTVQINDTSWTISIDFPRKAASSVQNNESDQIRIVLAKHGISMPEADSLTILVDSAARR